MLCYLSTKEQLTTLIDDQNNFVIYKYNSNSCRISEKTISAIQEAQSLGKLQYIYFIDIIEHREVSNELAEITGIIHESPQVIVFKDSKATKHASHMNITKDWILDNYPIEGNQ